ncbi:branched-chain amino acid ABC transporter substrate-binding protein [Streptomyces phaeochromogenes]|uniref:Branched-chain amino acid ABC transporter substrate-binding protein n=1 Tax=Streptomyces phaeochromogenes TaxID=1923 RepID=A0ABZ1HIR0_STRPH|nr:branched-chain amino acid ABC transporter substrate-binding protein [Streptomyces phaeochromogenes]MCX5597554.1 branched-chain amino acid ABC transporter substrate-binding protein [Streptomyces phaeochromogenes]WRZ33022.1 branched-chain amino acid ABC transporter substrate-binding protein [Streptomyces phaeochromogenes]WSD18507.1 branched-chain amino acid ABC transporter substrate-binding protein [Streptomyces phaeochromogenes]WSJ04682.1 branched-chain amino acid ABC transporter substrate-bi
MRQRSLIAITAALAAGALTLTACGSRDEDGGGSDSNGGGTTVVIGVDAPLTGDLSALGLGIKNSVDLAAKTANKEKTVDGVTFKVEALDDQAQPSSGQQNATKLVADKDVLGVVGPLNSSVAESMQKVFDDAKLVEVSPANTNPALTQGTKWNGGEKARPYKSYFRTATTDAIQGPFAAQYVFNDAKKKSVYVIDDKKTYGAGLAATFTEEFKKLGGKVVGTQHIDPDTKDFSAVATQVKSSGADVVYYGGEYPQAGPLSKQIKAAGAKIPLVGGDGIYSADFIKLAGASGTGDLATSVGAPVEDLPSAKEFVSAYKAAGYKEAYEAYGGYSYDSAWAIIEAVKKVVEDNDGKLPDDARAKVTEAMQGVTFDGVTGKVAFDEFGDATNKQLTVYSVEGGTWKPVKSGTYEG